MGKVTIYDLAKELNITASTVSRALQDHPRVSAKTKKAVQELAKLRNYHPNPIATQLRTGRGKVLGVIVPRIDRHFFASVIGGIESVAHEAGYSVLISQSNEKYEDEKSIIRSMITKQIDGIAVSLAAETVEYSHFQKLIDRGTPVLFFDRVPVQPIASTVQVDNEKVAYDTVMHLVEQGCKRIAHFAGPQSISSYKQRTEGYVHTLRDAGLEVDNQLIFDNCITMVTGEAAAREILAMSQRPDAIFSSGDYSAITLMNTLKQNGLSIPRDIAVVGFANEPFDTFVTPTLSSVDLKNRLMGESVAKLLIKEMAHETEEREFEHIVLEAEVIKRESSTRI